jgi:hypothetical protein
MLRVLVMLVAILWIAPARAEDVIISDEAKEHFRAGVALLDDPDGARYEEAYREFSAAYRASPSPKILGNLAICAMKLERDGEAIKAFEAYLEGAPDVRAAERRQIERDLKTLRATVVWLDLDVQPEGTSVVDERVPVHGEAVVNRYGPLARKSELGVRRGPHRLTFSKTGFRSHAVEIDASANRAVSIRLAPINAAEKPQPPPPSDSIPPMPLSAIVVASATGAVVIAAAITGGLALERHDAFEAENDGTNPDVAQQIRDQGMALSIATDVLIGVAAAGALTAVLLWLVPGNNGYDVASRF